eukprot:UN03299
MKVLQMVIQSLAEGEDGDPEDRVSDDEDKTNRQSYRQAHPPNSNKKSSSSEKNQSRSKVVNWRIGGQKEEEGLLRHDSPIKVVT